MRTEGTVPVCRRFCELTALRQCASYRTSVGKLLPQAQEREKLEGYLPTAPRSERKDRATQSDAGYNYGFRAGKGLELLRISDSGVSVIGLPLKMTQFGFWASVSTSSLA